MTLISSVCKFNAGFVNYLALDGTLTDIFSSYNASHTLRRRVEQMPSDLKIATAIIFGEPESMIDSDRSTSSNTEDSDGLALNSNISDKIYSDRYSRSLGSHFFSGSEAD